MTRFKAAHGELEPSTKEPKPEWTEVPTSLKAAIEAALGARVCSAEIIWGGYTPQANFRLSLANGQSVFCKSTHAGNTKRGAKAFQAEFEILQKASGLREFSPVFFGLAESEGWRALLFEFVADRETIPPWTAAVADAVLKRAGELHALPLDSINFLPNAFESEFVYPLLTGNFGWTFMSRDKDVLNGFCSLYEDSARVRDWASQNINTLAAIEAGASKVNWHLSLAHMDLRSDNILYSHSRGPLFVDWPYLSVGPQAFDLAFLLPSIQGEGGSSCMDLRKRYEELSGVTFSPEEIQTAAVLVAGFFAAQSPREHIEELPRLRWIQRLQAFPAVEWMCQELGIAPVGSRPKSTF